MDLRPLASVRVKKLFSSSRLNRATYRSPLYLLVSINGENRDLSATPCRSIIYKQLQEY